MADDLTKNKNTKITKKSENPTNPGFPLNSDQQDYPANPNILARDNNPTNPGYLINAWRTS